MADQSNGSWLQAALAAYAAYQNQNEHQKAAKQMSGPQTMTSTSWHLPYMNPSLEKLMPHILEEANRIYQSRQAFAGGNPAPFDISAIMGLPTLSASPALTGVAGAPGAGLGMTQASTSPFSGSSSGNTSGGEGIYNDISSRGNNMDMLTPEQHQASAHELTADDMKKLGKFGIDLAKVGVTGMAGGLGGLLNGGIEKLLESFKGKAGHGENKFLQSISERMKSVPMPDAMSHLKPDAVPLPSPRDKFNAPYNPGIGSKDIYAGTGSPWDWGENSYQDNGQHNTGGNWGGAGGGSNIWSMFSGGGYAN